jgi:transcriptional regulator with XRE-family HTH domain
VDVEEALIREGDPGSGAPAVAAAAVRSALDGIGRRLASLRGGADAELERLGAFLTIAEMAHLSQKEVAERAGVSRQTLLNLRSSGRGAGYEWPVDLRIMLELGFHGPQSVEGLADVLARGPISRYEIADAVARLIESGSIRELGSAVSGSSMVTYIRLTAHGADQLSVQLHHAAIPPSRKWTAYVVSTPAEVNAIASAGESLFGEHGAVVIPARTTADMTEPEVAFYVEASGVDEAAATAGALFRVLRKRAGLDETSRPVLVSTLVPPARAR